MKVKGVDISKLKVRQQAAMKSHAVHHTAKHLRAMKNMMLNGKTFTQSHKAAMKSVGK